MAPRAASRHPPGRRVCRTDGVYVAGDDGRLRRVVEDPEVVRRRRALACDDDLWERSARAADRRIAAEDAIAAKRRGAFAQTARRTPAARPAARRPRARRTTSASRDGPDDGDGEPEPAQGRPEALAGPSPRFCAPWRPALERAIAERLRALDRAQDGP